MRSFLFIVPMLALFLATPLYAQEPAGGDDLDQEVSQLVMQLGADAQTDRRAARERLLELSGPTAVAGERMLGLLPEPIDQMPAAVRTALASIRRTISERLAALAVSASRVTLDMVAAPLDEVLAEIEKQTGNQLKDLREQFGQRAPDRPVTIEIEDAPFWEAVDQVLDEAGLGVYSYAGEQAVALVGREPGATPRWATAAYAGPLRVEAIRVNAARNLRRVSGESLNLQLEVAWEPRLTPIAFSQPLSDVEAENENGIRLSMAQPEQTLNVEVSPGGQATEMTLPMLLPERKTKLIASLRGRLQAIVPGRQAEFRFAKLSEIDKPIKQQHGGATVTLESMRKSGEIWELRMRLRIDSAGGEGEADETENAFASHRGWVFNNITYLEDKQGNRLEHAGFETTMQRGNEIGLAYLFDIPASEEPAGDESAYDESANGAEETGESSDAADYVWVYKSPTAIVRFPVEYELNHIPLP